MGDGEEALGASSDYTEDEYDVDPLYVTRLTEFYTKYDPTQIKNVGIILQKVHGKEEQLFVALNKKYNVKEVVSQDDGFVKENDSSEYTVSEDEEEIDPPASTIIAAEPETTNNSSEYTASEDEEEIIDPPASKIIAAEPAVDGKRPVTGRGHILPKAAANSIANHEGIDNETFESYWESIAGVGATTISEGLLYKSINSIRSATKKTMIPKGTARHYAIDHGMSVDTFDLHWEDIAGSNATEIEKKELYNAVQRLYTKTGDDQSKMSLLESNVTLEHKVENVVQPNKDRSNVVTDNTKPTPSQANHYSKKGKHKLVKTKHKALIAKIIDSGAHPALRQLLERKCIISGKKKLLIVHHEVFGQIVYISMLNIPKKVGDVGTTCSITVTSFKRLLGYSPELLCYSKSPAARDSYTKILLSVLNLSIDQEVLSLNSSRHNQDTNLEELDGIAKKKGGKSKLRSAVKKINHCQFIDIKMPWAFDTQTEEEQYSITLIQKHARGKALRLSMQRSQLKDNTQTSNESNQHTTGIKHKQNIVIKNNTEISNKQNSHKSHHWFHHKKQEQTPKKSHKSYHHWFHHKQNGDSPEKSHHWFHHKHSGESPEKSHHWFHHKHHDESPENSQQTNGIICKDNTSIANNTEILDKEPKSQNVSLNYTPNYIPELSFDCLHSKIKDVRKTIAEGADVNECDSYMCTPLMYACWGGSVDIVKILLDSGANLRAVNQRGNFAVHIAFERNHVKLIEYFQDLPAAKVCLQFRNRYNKEPRALTKLKKFKPKTQPPLVKPKEDIPKPGKLASMVKMNNWKEVKKMVGLIREYYLYSEQERKRKSRYKGETFLKCNTTPKISEGPTKKRKPINKTNKTKNSELLLLQKRLSDTNINNGMSAMMYAAQKGLLKIVKLLVNSGANIKETDKKQNTALHYSYSKGQEMVSNFLCEYPSGLQCLTISNSMKQTPVHLGAIYTKRVSSTSSRNIKQLGKFHTKTKRTKSTKISKKSKRNRSKGCKNTKNNTKKKCNKLPNGWKPLPLELLAAASLGDLETVEILLNSGADVNEKDRNGQTSLMVASRRGYLDMIKLLIKNHAEVDLVDFQLNNILHFAAKNGHFAVTRWLLGAGGAEKCAIGRNNLLRTPAQVASTEPIKKVLHMHAQKIQSNLRLEQLNGEDSTDIKNNGNQSLHSKSDSLPKIKSSPRSPSSSPRTKVHLSKASRRANALFKRVMLEQNQKMLREAINASKAKEDRRIRRLDFATTDGELDRLEKLHTLQRESEQNEIIALIKLSGPEYHVPVRSPRSPRYGLRFGAPIQESNKKSKYRTNTLAGRKRVMEEKLRDLKYVENELFDIVEDKLQLRKLWKELDKRGSGKIKIPDLAYLLKQRWPLLSSKKVVQNAYKEVILGTQRMSSPAQEVEKHEFPAMLRNLLHFTKEMIIAESKIKRK